MSSQVKRWTCRRLRPLAKWNLSPGGRPGKAPGQSAACAKGKHTNCSRENCACTSCGHPQPTARAKLPERISEVKAQEKQVERLKTTSPAFRFAPTATTYHDDLEGAPAAHEYKVMLRRSRRGLCRCAGCDEPLVTTLLCERHRQREAEYKRRSYERKQFMNSGEGNVILSLTEKRVS